MIAVRPPGILLTLLPMILLAGMAAGVALDVRWPTATAEIALLATLMLAIGLGARQWVAQCPTQGWTCLFLGLWLLWSATGALAVSSVPDIAWRTLAQDTLGALMLLAGLHAARSHDARLWPVLLTTAGVAVCGVTAASLLTGDLASRLTSVWGGVNVNLVANLLIPLLTLPLAVPDIRARLGRPSFWFILLSLLIGLAFCLITGRRLALASMVLVACGAGLFRWPGRGARLLSLAVGAGVLALVIAMASGALTGSQSGDALRPLIYQAVWGEFLAHPVTGIGPAGGYALQEGASEGARILTASSAFIVHAHSTVGEILVSGGAVGLLLLAGAAAGVLAQVPVHRRILAGAVVGAFLPTILVDASAGGSLFGHLWVPLVLGCACAPASVEPAPARKTLGAFVSAVCLAATVGALWLLSQSISVALVGRDPSAERRLAAAHASRDPDIVSQLVSLELVSVGSDQAAQRRILLPARAHCGWFMRWPELLWSMRGTPPGTADMDALAAVLRRTPFQDAPYMDLAAIAPADRSPELARRAREIDGATADSPGIDGAAVAWRQTIATAFARPLTDSEKARYGRVFARYAEVPGVTAVALWLYARGDYGDPADFTRLRLRMKIGLADTSLFTSMLGSLAPEQLARLRTLDGEVRIGLPLPPQD